jgi:acetyl-CoA carboxylase carboxyl transferase subunit beta
VAAKQRPGWLSRLAPKIHTRAPRKVPEKLWLRCAETGEMVYRPDLEASQWVTPLGFHMRIGADLRFAYTFDGGRFEKLALPTTPDDPLRFDYGRPYRPSLGRARKATGEAEALAAAASKIGGMDSVVAVQDFAFIAGTLGAAVGERLVAAAEAALERQAALVVFTASGGARMQEGTLALMQMARATVAVERLRSAKLPYVVVLTDPTIGGVTASYAMLGDVQVVERGARAGLTGRRVIEQTVRQSLPDDYQSDEFLLDRGMADRIVSRKELPSVLGSLLRSLMLERDRLSAA